MFAKICFEVLATIIDSQKHDGVTFHRKHYTRTPPEADHAHAGSDIIATSSSLWKNTEALAIRDNRANKLLSTLETRIRRDQFQ